MNINATILGQVIAFIVILSIPILGYISYYLGKRKTQTPMNATFIGVLLAIIPPFALIYIALLALKNDVELEGKA